jgi:hypothetical protein
LNIIRSLKIVVPKYIVEDGSYRINQEWFIFFFILNVQEYHDFFKSWMNCTKVWYYFSNALWWNLNSKITKTIFDNEKIKLNFFNDNQV